MFMIFVFKGSLYLTLLRAFKERLKSFVLTEHIQDPLFILVIQ
jgi:hypothetical protein